MRGIPCGSKQARMVDHLEHRRTTMLAPQADSPLASDTVVCADIHVSPEVFFLLRGRMLPPHISLNPKS